MSEQRKQLNTHAGEVKAYSKDGKADSVGRFMPRNKKQQERQVVGKL